MVARETCDSRLVAFVALDDLKFAAAHFVAFRGFREPLHGHNYSVGIRVEGQRQGDGYIADFGELKAAARKLCKRLHSRTLLPTRCDALEVRQSGGQVEVLCEGGAKMSLPAEDCVLLPLEHTTCEELAEHLGRELLFGPEGLGGLLEQRGATWLEMSVSERPNQGATCRIPIGGASDSLEPKSLQRLTPRPCFSSSGSSGGMPTGPVRDEGSSSAGELTGGGGGAGAEEEEVTQPAPAEEEDGAAAAYRSLLLSVLGPEEASRPELAKTPKRAAKAFREMTAGLAVRDPLSVAREAVFDVEEARDLVCVREIPFHSICEHHLLPFSGKAHVAYFPHGRVLGLSKFARLVNVFARRPQLQERLTAQVAEAIVELLKPQAVAVSMSATHSCMCHRGVTVDASTQTLALRGPSRDDPAFRESLRMSVAFSPQATARL